MYDPGFNNLNIVYHEELDSTNAMAMQRIREGLAVKGEIIQTAFQSAGKGQHGNRWFSSGHKNLLVSFTCIDINLDTGRLPLLNMLVCLALYQTIHQWFKGRTFVKWPNDIYTDNKKTAGILIESVIAGNVLKHAVLGIGININEEHFPAELPDAASFYTLSGVKFEDKPVLEMLIRQLNQHLSEVHSGSPVSIVKRYNDTLYHIGQKLYFRRPEGSFEGILRGVNADGKLCVESGNQMLTFYHKEVSF